MAPDPPPGRHSVSPEGAGRDSPIPRQWRNQIDGAEERLLKDKHFRKYAAVVDKALSFFETALEEWADYISFLNRLLKALQARPSSVTAVPSRATLAKRLSQCLNPSLPSGVHQKALEVYDYVFTTIGKDGLSRDLPLYLPGLASVLSFASLSVRSPYLDMCEKHFLQIDPRSLRPAMRSIVLALLPGLEDETAEDFDRTLKLMTSFKESIRPADSELLTDDHASGDDYFWQCFFLACITSSGRRPGALAYLTRYLPPQGGAADISHQGAAAKNGFAHQPSERVSAVVTTPEPGLLIRCFASGLFDEQLLIQRGFLDLLVTHLPLSSSVLQTKVKRKDLELLLRSVVGVVTRRDMSLNRRLWAWFLGPEPGGAEADQGPDSSTTPSEQPSSAMASRTRYFEEFGLQSLTAALLGMVGSSDNTNPTERARPYRICLSLMDRWEIGGLIVPEVFLPVVENVRLFKDQASSKAEFSEVLRSASVFFDGIESGLIYSELVSLLAQAIGPGSLSADQRKDKLSLISFILANFNVREEEMVTIHAPLSCLAALAMLADLEDRRKTGKASEDWVNAITEQALGVAVSLLEMVPSRAFADPSSSPEKSKKRPQISDTLTNMELLKKIQGFYVNEQGNIEVSAPPFESVHMGELILRKSVQSICQDFPGADSSVRILTQGLVKMPSSYSLDKEQLMVFLRERLALQEILPFQDFSSLAQLSTELHLANRIPLTELSELATLLVRHAWHYLSAAEPKFHVETVRCLWQLQTSLSLSSRDIEAALSGLLIQRRQEQPLEAVKNGQTFNVLWSHTLQDNPSDRRGSRTPALEARMNLRLAGMDYFEVMLTRPLFLILDNLDAPGTPQQMATKSWLNNMIGIDRLFLIFIYKFVEIGFLADLKDPGNSEKRIPSAVSFDEHDDLDLCLYYLRTLSNVLRVCGDTSWDVLASKHVSLASPQPHISTGGEEGDMTLQEFLVRVCLRCITGDATQTADVELRKRVSELHRFTSGILHQFFLSQQMTSLAGLNLENLFLERLSRSIANNDPYVQLRFMDVVYDALKLRDATTAEPPSTPPPEKRPTSLDPARTSRQSLSLSDSRPIAAPPPPQLLKCLQAALASAGSRPVLDSWVAFLAECLPFYSGAIFQVLIPLVETLCDQIGTTFTNLRGSFRAGSSTAKADSLSPESTLIYLLNGLEQVLASAHDQLLSEEERAQLVKSPDQPQSIFGSMVSGVFQSDGHQPRSAIANDRLTVHLALQDAARMCYKIWSWGVGNEATQQDNASSSSFNHTSLRMRNRARRLLEHLFTAENLECLETVIDIWRASPNPTSRSEVFNLLSALDASRPRHSIPALFNSIYSRTNPGALEPSRKSTMTISLDDSNLVVFLVEYTRSLDDDAMDEIWQDCMVFLKDLLSNPFPHRQNLPHLLEFAAILGEKVDNTNFGEQRKMRRELGDLFLRLLTALFTTRPITLEISNSANSDKGQRTEGGRRGTSAINGDDPEDVVAILASIVPNLPKILVESDRVLTAANSISSNVIGPTIRSKGFPNIVGRSTVDLLLELSRLQNNQKAWKKDVSDAFNEQRFFGMDLALVEDGWIPLLRQWILADKEKVPELVGRISAPSTAGIVFGVGATSARLEADRKTQVNLRRIATLILASTEDAFVGDLPTIFDKLVELLGATSTSSPSSATRADLYMVVRALVLKTSPIHLAMLWPVVNSEIHAAISSVAAPDNSTASDTYANYSILQACKLLDLLICIAPDEFQLHEWLFITDTVDAVYRHPSAQPVALVDELSEELGSAAMKSATHGSEAAAYLTASSSRRRPLLGPVGINDDVSIERREELVSKILRPFFGQLSIFAFESTYAMGVVDRDFCVKNLLKDLFDERSIARAL